MTRNSFYSFDINYPKNESNNTVGSEVWTPQVKGYNIVHKEANQITDETFF